MHRRNILWGAISAFGAALAASRAGAAGEAAPPAKLKVVYHLNDLDKVSFALGNIQNHFDGVGGPDHVTIALVVHGQALRAFHSGFSTRAPDSATAHTRSPMKSNIEVDRSSLLWRDMARQKNRRPGFTRPPV